MGDMPRCPNMVRVAPLLAQYDEYVATHWQHKQEELPLLRVLVGMMVSSQAICHCLRFIGLVIHGIFEQVACNFRAAGATSRCSSASAATT